MLSPLYPLTPPPQRVYPFSFFFSSPHPAPTSNLAKQKATGYARGSPEYQMRGSFHLLSTPRVPCIFCGDPRFSKSERLELLFLDSARGLLFFSSLASLARLANPFRMDERLYTTPATPRTLLQMLCARARLYQAGAKFLKRRELRSCERTGADIARLIYSHHRLILNTSRICSYFVIYNPSVPHIRRAELSQSRQSTKRTDSRLGRENAAVPSRRIYYISQT